MATTLGYQILVRFGRSARRQVGPGSAILELSRRRSRVRVPSLPLPDPPVLAALRLLRPGQQVGLVRSGVALGVFHVRLRHSPGARLGRPRGSHRRSHPGVGGSSQLAPSHESSATAGDSSFRVHFPTSRSCGWASDVGIRSNLAPAGHAARRGPAGRKSAPPSGQRSRVRVPSLPLKHFRSMADRCA